MKNNKSLAFLLFLSMFLMAANLFGQIRTMEGKQGDICYDTELQWVSTPPDGSSTLYNSFINCVAGHYSDGDINLYEVRQRVGHGTKLKDVLSTIAWTYCSSAGGNCVENYIQYLLNLDSDQDGLEDLHDATPFGNTNNNTSDEDGDGVEDNADACDNTPPGSLVNSQGCPQVIIKAESIRPFYSVEDDFYTVIGRVWDPTGKKGLAGTTISFPWHNGVSTISIMTEADGSFEVNLAAINGYPNAYSVIFEANHPNYASNETTVTFGVRSVLDVIVTTDKNSYIANETIHITGQVFSPEPIGSDLGIQCELRVYDHYRIDAPPYRIQRVPLRSDGRFSYDVPIYGPNEKGKWLETGLFGNWIIKAIVVKDGLMVHDMEYLDVYKNQAAKDAEVEIPWEELKELDSILTAEKTPVYLRPSHNEAIIVGPQTKAITKAKANIEQSITSIDGVILYLKDIRHQLLQSHKELMKGNLVDYIKLEGLYVECSSPNSAYVLETDAKTKMDRITVYDGPITISSKDGSFSSFELENHTQIVVNKQGVQAKKSLSIKELRALGEPFEKVLGTNPTDLEHLSNNNTKGPTSDEPSDLSGGLIDYGLYIGLGGLVLVLLIFVIVKMTKKTPEKPSQSQTTKTSTDDGWEATTICSKCGQVIPKGSKFCPACGTKQS